MSPDLEVWATGRRDRHRWFTERGCVAGAADDTAGIPPAVAARVIARYTRPGDTVLDPDCGAGAVLVEALHAGRHAVGATAKPRWWRIARANVTGAKRAAADGDGMVLDAGPRNIADAATEGLAGRAALVLTAVRPDLSPRPGAGDEPGPAGTGTPDPSRGGAAEERIRDDLTRLLTWCQPLVQPGGYVVVAAQPLRHRFELLDLPGCVLSAGRAAGFRPDRRIVALTAEPHGRRRAVDNSLEQRRFASGRERATGYPVALASHSDVFVFRHADTAGTEGRVLFPFWPPIAGRGVSWSAADARELAAA
ncbi:DNA methyltransferase [Yinghuangia sp. YIM S10712]|uniref:DNA methyltransferase n=1 Tax=Yinghuangia sp. YIM S10712 TaxID=3436930 RepID=UPI003F52D086